MIPTVYYDILSHKWILDDDIWIMIPIVYYGIMDILCDDVFHSKFYDIERYPTSLTQSYAMFAISQESPIVVKDGRFWPLNPEVSESPA